MTAAEPFSPATPFRYCPADGTKLGEARASGGTTCPECGRSWYRNSAPTVGAAIVQNGQALVTVRGIEPEKGKIDVPGGFLEVGEHPVDGLKREAREELGVEVEVDGEPVQLATHTYGEDGAWVLAPSGSRRVSSRENRSRRTTWRSCSGYRLMRWMGWSSRGSTTAGSCGRRS